MLLPVSATQISAACGTMTLLHTVYCWLCVYDCSSAVQNAAKILVTESLLSCTLYTTPELSVVVTGRKSRYSDGLCLIKQSHAQAIW